MQEVESQLQSFKNTAEVSEKMQVDVQNRYFSE